MFDAKGSFAYHTFKSTAAPGGDDVVYFAQSSDGGLTWPERKHLDLTLLGDGGSVFYPPITVDPGVSQRLLLGAHYVYVANFGSGPFVQKQSSGDLTSGCTNGLCAIEDIEFARSDNTKAWALAMGHFPDSPAVPFKLSNTIEADCPDQPTCPSPGVLANWKDVTPNLELAMGGSALVTQATSVAVDEHDPNDA